MEAQWTGNAVWAEERRQGFTDTNLKKLSESDVFPADLCGQHLVEARFWHDGEDLESSFKLCRGEETWEEAAEGRWTGQGSKLSLVWLGNDNHLQRSAISTLYCSLWLPVGCGFAAKPGSGSVLFRPMPLKEKKGDKWFIWIVMILHRDKH